MPPPPAVSIVIPTLGRPDLLGRCLDSIEATVQVPFEIVCVTVRGDEQTQARLEGRDVRNVVQPERDGFVRAANAGFRVARGTYLMQMNDDCEILPHAITNAIHFLEARANHGVGVAAFFHDAPVRRNVYAQIMVEETWYFVCHVRGLCYANFGLARRILYEQLDFWDERFFMYGADPDFSLRVWHEANQSVLPCPGALIHHAEVVDERAGRERAEQETDNRALFDKWGWS